MPVYKDGKGMATAILVLLGIYLVLAVVGAVSSTTQVQSSTNGVRVVRSFDGPLGFITVGLFVALAILTPMWLARAHRNAEALSGSPISNTPGWTAGAWFIPLVGGFLAARPLARVWERIPGGNKAAPLAWAILWSLWFCVIVVMLVAATVMAADAVGKIGHPPPLSASEQATISKDVASRLGPIDLVLSLVLIAAGVCMGLTVRAIQAAQTRAAQAGAPGSPKSPPPLPEPWK